MYTGCEHTPYPHCSKNHSSIPDQLADGSFLCVLMWK